MSIITGTQAVTAAAVAVTVTGAFGTGYQVSVSPSWVTAFSVTGETATQFVVTFSVPAPAAGGSIDWAVFGTLPSGGAGVQNLSGYLTELRDLLHDPNDGFWPLANKIGYINRAMNQRDLDTEQNRQLFTFTLIVGTDTYTFTQVGNNQVFDVIAINLIYVSTRVILEEKSLTMLNATKRPWTPYQGVPEAWARYGPNQVILGPNPSFAYTTEWDCAVYSNPLVSLTDPDPLPYPYTKPVAHYAASLAKRNERQYDEADAFLRDYYRELNTAINSRVGSVRSAYDGLTRV
jgi:hypothetical protein